MDRSELSALQTFVTIAEQGSLRAAARTLGVNPPAVSHQLKAFEARLGTPLFLRTTRSIALTDTGRRLYESCSHLLGAAEEALDSAREGAVAQSGRLRITLPYRAWQLIVAPKLASFRADHSGIDLDLNIEESLIDIVAQGFHAGIRLGDHLQENMIAVPLSRGEPAALVASPDYLSNRGAPRRPEDLLRHDCIRHRQVTSGRISRWRFGEVTVDIGGSLIVNDLRTVVDAARRGFGIGWTLKRGVESELEQGMLVEVLPGLVSPRPGFSLYYPRSLRGLGLLRSFIEAFRLP